MNEKQIYVIFGDKKIESEFESLIKGKFQDKQLYANIEKAMIEIKKNPDCGTKIQKRLWPVIYREKYSIINLWKYNLPNGWRLIYTLKVDEVMILGIILEWFNHKEYEKRFKY